MEATAEIVSGSTSVADILGHWWIIRTKSNLEFSLASKLAAEGIAFYLPTAIRHRILRGVKGDFVEPLFRGFVFVAVSDAPEPVEIDFLWETRRIWGLIPVMQQKRFVEDLERVESTLKACPMLASNFHRGMRCRIKQGHPLYTPFGTEAWIDRARDRHGVVVALIQTLGASRPLEIDVAFLEPWD